MAAEEEEFSAITDKIPQRPVSVVEGTSYTLVILAALGVRVFLIHIRDNVFHDSQETNLICIHAHGNGSR